MLFQKNCLNKVVAWYQIETPAQLFSSEFWKIFYDSFLMSWTFASDQSMKSLKLSKILFFENTMHTNVLVTTDLFNDYNLPDLAKEKTSNKILQHQICIDVLQISDGRNVFQTILHCLTVSHILIAIRKV